MRIVAETYHREHKGNCAQAVAHAWNERHPDRAVSVDEFARCGVGRAPGGLCGALHVGLELAGAAHAQALRDDFMRQTNGAIECKAVRASKTLTCNQCVGCVAECLERITPNGAVNRE